MIEKGQKCAGGGEKGGGRREEDGRCKRRMKDRGLSRGLGRDFMQIARRSASRVKPAAGCWLYAIAL